MSTETNGHPCVWPWWAWAMSVRPSPMHLLLSGLASEIVLIDANRAKAEGEAMDLNHTVPFAFPRECGRATSRIAPAHQSRSSLPGLQAKARRNSA